MDLTETVTGPRSLTADDRGAPPRPTADPATRRSRTAKRDRSGHSPPCNGVTAEEALQNRCAPEAAGVTGSADASTATAAAPPGPSDPAATVEPAVSGDGGGLIRVDRLGGQRSSSTTAPTGCSANGTDAPRTTTQSREPALPCPDERGSPLSNPGPPRRPPRPQAPEPERWARAALTRLTEPGDAAVGRTIGRLGAVALVDAIRAGAPPSLLELSAGRLDAYRARLRDIDPLADLERARTRGGRFIIPGDPEWPSQLDDLGDGRPVGLWIRGSGSLRMLALRSVSVVGSRACTPYGRYVAGQLCSQLAERGWVIVSGAAYGIDAAAHQGALAVGGITVAVLACGVDVAYPPGNAELIERIAAQGLLVSELPLSTHPNRFRFVLRNRVIAALTRGTVVVEAALRSGALSTARRARDLNRHTMGVAGPVTSDLSAGVHALIRSGAATLVTDGAEIGELIGSIGEDLAPRRSGPVLPRDLLEPPVARVLEAVPATAEGAPPERLARQAGLSVDDTLKRLYELGSLGYVERYGAHWRLVRRRRPAGP
ncbi:DNA-processing protein DprA [Kitasatospora cinereorecta]|uniref:DNA-processing protein DprA n=1 Tax=Kitasatospora cinereorecta TaxID=285560 RepID=UPI00336FD341